MSDEELVDERVKELIHTLDDRAARLAMMAIQIDRARRHDDPIKGIRSAQIALAIKAYGDELERFEP